MQYLMELDASNNSIKKLLDFAPPKNLISVNLSFNDISEMSDLSDHSNLQYLCLDSILFDILINRIKINMCLILYT